MNKHYVFVLSFLCFFSLSAKFPKCSAIFNNTVLKKLFPSNKKIKNKRFSSSSCQQKEYTEYFVGTAIIENKKVNLYTSNKKLWLAIKERDSKQK